MTDHLSPPQQRVLDAILQFRADHTFSPSVRDIAGIVGRSISTVNYHIGRLEALGIIAREPRTSRTIRIVSN